ncbi:hypothetical protein D3C72_1621540 [compost metagenome]
MKKLFFTLAMACGIAGVAQSAQAAGNVDAATMHSARGWACDPGNPYFQGTIQAYRDDGLWVGSLDVNQASEPAVNSICGGGSVHRFNGSWSVNPALVDNKNHYVYFYQTVAGQDALIPGSPKLVGFCYATLSPSGLCP